MDAVSVQTQTDSLARTLLFEEERRIHILLIMMGSCAYTRYRNPPDDECTIDDIPLLSNMTSSADAADDFPQDPCNTLELYSPQPG